MSERSFRKRKICGDHKYEEQQRYGKEEDTEENWKSTLSSEEQELLNEIESSIL